MVYTISIIVWINPLMPIKYIVLIVGGDERDNILVRILVSRITELEKLLEARM
jgi:hypothetical protein